MLAGYFTWHLREALAELTVTDQHTPADPVAPAQRSAQAKANAKDGSMHNRDGLPVDPTREAPRSPNEPRSSHRLPSGGCA
ncbi:MAG TPA: hypothetical protein VLW50_20860 [Streptosporangiaceae bacterium]|nr:hypothetical protein [Streptosporangiaceae bacterium]